MDITPTISTLIGCLSATNRNINLASIKYRGGKEDKINQVVHAIKQVFKAKDLTKQDQLNPHKSEELRCVTFFFILNSDLKVLHRLTNSDELGNVVCKAPRTSPCLLVNIIWELKLQDYLCEAIQYCSYDLSYELLLVASKNLNHLTPETSFAIATQLIFSIYQKLISLYQDTYKYESFQLKLDKTTEILFWLLRYFTDLPFKEKEDQDLPYKGKQAQALYKLHRHLGRCLLLFLKNINTCFQSYIVKPKTPVNLVTELYSTTLYNEKLYENNDPDKQSILNILETFFNKINLKIADVLMETVMTVDINLFCAWCEFTDETNTSKNLQRVIGENACELIKLLKSDPRFQHQVISVLESISIEPLAMDELIAVSDKETLLENCNIQSPDQSKWIHGLLCREKFFQDQDFINCVVQNYEAIEDRDLKHLVSKGLSALCGGINYEHKSKIRSMTLLMLSRLPLDEQLQLTFMSRNIENRLEMEDFDIQVNEFCNKLVNFEDSSLSYLYGLFIQNPEAFTNKMVSLALGSKEQMNAALRVFEILARQMDSSIARKAPNRNHPYLSRLLLDEILQVDIDTDSTYILKKHYVELIDELNKRSLFHREPVLQFVMDQVSDCLYSNNSVVLVMFLEILDKIYDYDSHMSYATAIIVMMAQVMESFRWYQGNYNANSCYLITWCANYILDNSDKLFNTVTLDKNAQLWLLKNLNFLTPINAHYFQPILKPREPIKLIDCTLKPNDLKKCLFYLIPSSTCCEFFNIYLELKSGKGTIPAFDLLCDTIQKISAEAEILKTPEAFNCLKFCIQNLGSLFYNNIVREIDTGYVEYLKKVLGFIRLLHAHVQPNAFKCFISGISNIVSKALKEEKVTLAGLKKLEEMIIDSESKKLFQNLCCKN